MSLSLKEQLSLFGQPIAERKLIDYVFQAGVNYASQFYDGVKVVDSTTHPKADSYKNKMLNVCNQVVRIEANRNSGMVNNLERVFISVVGLSAVTYAQTQSATEAQWMAFITTNMKEVFENIAGVMKEEATEYNGI